MSKPTKSFDFKLMSGYHVGMMLMIPVGFILPSKYIISAAASLILILSLIALIHKNRSGWHWIKPDIKGIGMGIFSIVSGGVLIFVISNSFGGIQGPITSFICAGVGIIYFNFMAALNFADRTSEDHQNRLQINPINQRVEKKDNYTLLRNGFRVFFYLSWFAGMYLFYSSTQYTNSYSKEKTTEKKVEVSSHGKTYYVNKTDQDHIRMKSVIIIPLFVVSILFPLFMKSKYGVDLLKVTTEKASSS